MEYLGTLLRNFTMLGIVCEERLAYGLFQLMHMTHDDHAVRVEQAMVARRKAKIITALTTLPQG